jgi:hypothetical protein
MRRPFLAFLLSFALLGMQHELAVHAFSHLAGGQKQGYTAPQKAQACLTCELLASGTDGIPASMAATPVACTSAPVAPVGFTTRAVAAPACYSSRAPPPLL